MTTPNTAPNPEMPASPEQAVLFMSAVSEVLMTKGRDLGPNAHVLTVTGVRLPEQLTGFLHDPNPENPVTDSVHIDDFFESPDRPPIYAAVTITRAELLGPDITRTSRVVYSDKDRGNGLSLEKATVMSQEDPASRLQRKQLIDAIGQSPGMFTGIIEKFRESAEEERRIGLTTVSEAEAGALIGICHKLAEE